MIGCIVLLVAAGGILLVAGRDLVELVAPGEPADRGPAVPSGTADLGHAVAVTVPAGWSVESSDSDSATLSRGRSRLERQDRFIARTSTTRASPPPDACDRFLSQMAETGLTGATFTSARTIKESARSSAAECSVTGTATGAFGSGPFAIRCFVAATADNLYGIGCLYYVPARAEERVQQDYALMIDSIWDSMLD